MTPRKPEPELRVEECQRQAREMMDAAAAATSESAKVEFLRLATEWVKLATEISDRMGDPKN